MQLSGLDLRYALTAVLLRTGVPLRIPDLVRALEREGDGPRAGRAGSMPKQTRSRIVRRVAELRHGSGG